MIPSAARAMGILHSRRIFHRLLISWMPRTSHGRSIFIIMLFFSLPQAYQEDYPGDCFDEGSYNSLYYRKHNPFIGFENIRSDPERCARIVNADQLSKDLEANAVCILYTFLIYIFVSSHGGCCAYLI